MTARPEARPRPCALVLPAGIRLPRRPLHSRAVRRVRQAAPVLGVWAAWRLGVLTLSWPAMFVTQGSSRQPRSWLGLWQNWDAHLLLHIAQYGYFGPAGHPVAHQAAFLPGYPVAVWLAHWVIPQWTAAGLAVSLAAGAVAVVALARLADDLTAGTGRRAVLFLLASPAAVFLAAAYTESLFLALALPAWLAARRGRWLLAGVLTGGACMVRAEGLFLLAALAVAAAASGQGRWRALGALVPALGPPAGFVVHLHSATGDWLAWLHAQAAGWDRHYTGPLAAFRMTWAAAFSHHWLTAPYAFAFQLELLAAAAGAAGAVALALARKWPEAAYCALTIGALATSTWYESVPRALLVLWPLWWGLARLCQRRPWAGQVYLWVSAPLAAVTGLLYLTGRWAG